MMALQENVLTDALAQALETMAFMDLEPLGQDLHPPQQPVLTVICFYGPKQGQLQVLSSLSLGRLLAETIGCLAAPSDEEALDAWQEVGNVVCGLILPRIAASPLDVYDVTIPTVTVGAAAPTWNQFVDQPTCRIFNVAGHAVAATLHMEEEVS